MREIIFRGKSLDGGEWIEGNLIRMASGDVGIMSPNIIDLIYVIARKVDPATVGQFTGLYDKNGKKIFEGDICEHRHGDRHIVCFGQYMDCSDGKQVGFYLAEAGCMLCGIYAPNTYEVIGNIHDSPELLEVQHEDN